MNESFHSTSDYVTRVIDRQVQRALKLSGAVVIEGPRACGKTSTALNAAASAIYLDDDSAQQIAQLSPIQLLVGENPRLLDEWQLVPRIWNLVRREVDHRRKDGQFILTGSSVPDDDQTRHTGAGRFLRLRQRSMTWYERLQSEESQTDARANEGPSKPGVSLEGLFGLAEEYVFVPQTQQWDYETVVSWLCRTGFPAHIHRDAGDSLEVMRAYADELARSDIHRIADIRHDPGLITALLEAVARSVASEVTFTTLAKDVRKVAPGITADTVSRYVGLLERLFVVEAIPAWNGRLNSRATVRRSPRLNLADPSLAAALMNASPRNLVENPQVTGLLFESAVLHDIAVMAESLGGRLYHFRDSNGNEIDAVIVLPDGRWGGIEVKLGGNAAQDAARNLRRVAGVLDAGRPPSFLAVITGTGMSLPLGEGCVTFPLHELRP